MAIVRRYFSTSGAGAADGTTWADRAPFLSAGVISTIIRGFDFTSDSLEVYIGPGTYNITTVIATFTGAAAPSVFNPCWFIACDSSGNKWEPPDPDWVSAQPMWDDSTMPVWTNGTNQFLNNSACGVYGLKMVGSHLGTVLSAHLASNWCYVENTVSHGNSVAIGTGFVENVVACCSGTLYNAVTNASPSEFNNVRLIGNISATSGNRNGWASANNAAYYFKNVTVINNAGIPLYASAVTSLVSLYMKNILVWNSTATAGACISCAGTRTNVGFVRNALIVRATTYGIDVTGTTRHVFLNNAFRDCSSGNVNGGGNHPLNDTTITESDADLFVDSANLDLRIKNTSAYWGRNLGAGDQPAAGGGSAGFPLSRLVM